MALAANSVEGRAKPFLQRIENLMSEGESAKGEYMNECKQRREEIKDVLTEAAEEGIPKKALRGLVKYRELEKRQQEIADGLEDQEQADYESLIAALGPLGQAAADKAKAA